jgi:hypothetical protein
VTRRFTPDDLKDWRDLVAVSRRIAAAPEGRARPLTRSAARAGKACLPEGHVRTDSPFVQLQRLAARFGLLTGVERIRTGPELLALADAVGRELGAPKAPTPAVRYRADIEG